MTAEDLRTAQRVYFDANVLIYLCLLYTSDAADE